LRQGWGLTDERFAIATICEKMGWTFQEYLEQPYDFIEVVKAKLQAENKIIEEQQEQNGR